VLARSKYYKGNRPHNANSITINVNTNLDTSLLQVRSNQRDYDMFGLRRPLTSSCTTSTRSSTTSARV
jgi:hypothetical protein